MERGILRMTKSDLTERKAFLTALQELTATDNQTAIKFLETYSKELEKGLPRNDKPEKIKNPNK